MTVRRSNEWKSLAEQASKEMDPQKLLILVKKLNHMLDEEYGALDQHRSPREDL